MKIIKLLSVLLISMSMLTLAPASIAASKADKQKQAQQKKQAKKKIKENKKHYKKVQKPAFKKQKAANRKAQKQAKKAIKNNKKQLKSASQEENKFYKARMASKKALLKQGAKMEAAQRKAELKPTPKNLKVKQDLETRYNKAFKDYQNGPKKRWQEKSAAKTNAKQALANSRSEYAQAKVGGVKIALARIQAKAAIKNIKPVSNGLYDIKPIISRAGLQAGESRGLNAAKGKQKQPIYDVVPPLLSIYDRVDPKQMVDYGKNNYASANAALQF